MSIVNQSSVGEREYLSYNIGIESKICIGFFRFALFPAKTRVLARFRTCLLAIEGS